MDTESKEILERIEKKIDNIISMIGQPEDVKEDAKDIPVTDDDKKEVVDVVNEEKTESDAGSETTLEN